MSASCLCRCVCLCVYASVIFYTVPTALNDVYPRKQYTRLSVRRDLYTPKGCIPPNMVCQFVSKSSTFLTFIFKVQDSNGVHWKVQTWLSLKRWQIGHTLLLATHRKSHVAFRLSYLHFTLDYSKGHALFECEFLANGDKANVAVPNE